MNPVNKCEVLSGLKTQASLMLRLRYSQYLWSIFMVKLQFVSQIFSLNFSLLRADKWEVHEIDYMLSDLIYTGLIISQL